MASTLVTILGSPGESARATPHSVVINTQSSQSCIGKRGRYHLKRDFQAPLCSSERQDGQGRGQAIEACLRLFGMAGDPGVPRLCHVPFLRIGDGGGYSYLGMLWLLWPRHHACIGDSEFSRVSAQLEGTQTAHHHPSLEVTIGIASATTKKGIFLFGFWYFASPPHHPHSFSPTINQ